ncbi:hypothetical protein COCMIDRAFT_92268, partial [Bipolaris oryzae ATCC 44560]
LTAVHRLLTSEMVFCGCTESDGLRLLTTSATIDHGFGRESTETDCKFMRPRSFRGWPESVSTV